MPVGFPMGKVQNDKGAIKMHCLYDHAGALPTFLTVTDGKKHDVRGGQRQYISPVAGQHRFD